MREPDSRQIYYWNTGFIMATSSFELDRRNQPYRRISATLIVSLSGEFELEVADGRQFRGNAVLLAPMIERRVISAKDCDLVICDQAMTAPEYTALASVLGGNDLKPIDLKALDTVVDEFRAALDGTLPDSTAPTLMRRVTRALTGLDTPQPELPRAIARALPIIDEMAFDELTPSGLAELVHISSSRLRQLFSEHLGCTISQYIRWAAVWKVIWQWSRGRPVIEVAVEAGFHDAAHVNRAFREIFGTNPTESFRPQQVVLRRCPSLLELS